METPTRELVIDELAGLPEIGLFEVLDFVRFLKSQRGGMTSDERFDRAWMVTRRFAAESAQGMGALLVHGGRFLGRGAVDDEGHPSVRANRAWAPA